MTQARRLTKIVATWGPSVASEERLRQLIRAGVDVFRLNFSHGTHADFDEAIPRIRALAAAAGHEVALLQDIQGPRLRTGLLPNHKPVELKDGSTVTITGSEERGSAHHLSIPYPHLTDDVKAGQRILIADGTIILRALAVKDGEIEAEVVHGGVMSEHKGVNLPDSSVSAEPLTPKDKDDLAYGARMELDYVALSFVRRRADVAACRELITSLGRKTPIIAKIEHPEAITNLEEIFDESDGVMVARGDLGVEMSPERVPMLQKHIIQRANEIGLPVITATQMLESMVERPVPTRAEASDIANAILDGTDAVMLSAETAAGKFPVQAVETMVRIAREAEAAKRAPIRRQNETEPFLTAAAARQLAFRLDAQAMLVFTHSGQTAETLSQQRPHIPIYALTPEPATCRKLNLWFGVWPVLSKITADVESMVELGLEELRDLGLANADDRIVVFGSAPVSAGGPPNLINVRTVPAG